MFWTPLARVNDFNLIVLKEMKRTILFLACCCAFWGCSEQVQEPPLTVPQMIDVLTDVRILEGAYSAAVTKPDTLRPYMAKYYDQVFARHGMDYERYYKAYDYYMSRPEIMESIEDSVINRISDRLNSHQ